MVVSFRLALCFVTSPFESDAWRFLQWQIWMCCNSTVCQRRDHGRSEDVVINRIKQSLYASWNTRAARGFEYCFKSPLNSSILMCTRWNFVQTSPIFSGSSFLSGQITHFWLDVTVDSWRQNLLHLFWGLFYPKLEPDLKLIKEAYPFFNQLWVWQQSFNLITWNTTAVIFIYVVNKFVFFATHYKRNKHFSVFVNLTLNYWNNIFAIVFSTS